MPPSDYITETDRVLHAMFTENTGRHFLDSGGAYGRDWEREQKRDAMLTAAGIDPLAFRVDRPDATLTLTHDWEPEVSIDTFHYLRERLEYAPEYDDAFRDGWDEDSTYRDEVLRLLDALGVAGTDDVFGVNTYNYESALDKVLQFDVFVLDDYVEYGGVEWEPDVYVVLQVHGGCDVRGGYTAPRVFRVTGMEGMYSLCEDTRVSVGCTSCDVRWTSEHGGYDLRDERTGDPFPAVVDPDRVDDGEPNGTARRIVREVLDEHDEHELLLEFPPLVTVDGACPECADGTLGAMPF